VASKPWSDNQRDTYLREKYGITLEQYNELLDEQRGKCALCRKPPRKRFLAVDHDHETGAVRGLLCTPCNTTMGFIDKVGIGAIVRYLLRGFRTMEQLEEREPCHCGNPRRGHRGIHQGQHVSGRPRKNELPADQQC
jgi:hypothetical protein